jgi:hypothetical protein
MPATVPAGVEKFEVDGGGEVDGEDGRGGVLQQRSPSVHRVLQEDSLAGGVVGGGEGGGKDEGRGAAWEDGGVGGGGGVRIGGAVMDEVDLRCPISLELMQDPVIALDGHTYEREAIEKWFECSNSSPLTNEKLDSKV